MADENTPAADLIAEYHATASPSVQSFKEMLASLDEEMIPPPPPAPPNRRRIQVPTKMRKHAEEPVILEGKRVEEVRVGTSAPGLCEDGQRLLLPSYTARGCAKTKCLPRGVV